MIAAYVLRRLLATIPVLLGVTLVTFLIMHITAGSHIPGLQISPNLTPDTVAQIRHNLGLDKPLHTQYVDWLWNAIRGDFGRSLQDQTSVSHQIFTRLPATLELTGTAVLLALLFAIPVGVIGAVRRGSKVDHTLTAISVAGFAIPQFWLGLILILIFSVQFQKWGLPSLPQSGQESVINGGGFLDRLEHIVMPATVLSFFYVATWSRYLRSTMIEVLSRDYIRTAMAKGMPRRRAVLVHGLRNGLVPLVTLIGLTLPYLVSGALVVEIVFGWPGIGLFAYQRALDFDYTTVLGVTTFVAFLVVAGSLLADLAAMALDPRLATEVQDGAGAVSISPSIPEDTHIDVGEVPMSRGYWRESGGRLLADRTGMVSAGILIAFAFLALTAPFIATHITGYTPDQQDLLDTFAPPSSEHWLGTDELGRDTLTRLLYGARVTLGVGALAVAVQLLIGTLVGMSAGFYGRWLDQLLMRFVDSVLAFPDIFLFMLVAVLIRPTPVALALIIAAVGWADVSRLIRAEVLTLKGHDFILATRSIGASNRRIMFGHILRNAMPTVIVAASLRVGQVILIEAALDFLGLGVQPPTPSWGNMLSNAQQYFYHSYWLVVLPGVAIFLTVLATNLLGNALRDALDPRLRHGAIQL